jgi:hypothetical protein
MQHYSNDPKQLKARFDSSCSKCAAKISKGQEIYYWPSSREVFCLKCGEGPYNEFLASAQDEETYQSWYR